MPHYTTKSPLFWDLICVCSIIGIWPRFIEPHLLQTNRLTLHLPKLPKALNNLKIIQLSDLHLGPHLPDFFLKKIVRKVEKEHPDLLLFTGDFLCYSTLQEKGRLKQFLKKLHGRYGNFAILGNHDYAQKVAANALGEYDIAKSQPQKAIIYQKLRGLFKKKQPLQKRWTEQVKNIDIHHELAKLLHESGFQLLHNSTQKVPIKNSFLNICGVGEHTTGQCQPTVAFKNYDTTFPGIVMAHNPDSFPHLKSYPGELILCGHTHGMQVNLPWIAPRITRLENGHLRRGLFHLEEKWLYVSKGVGSVFPLRLFALPEITTFTLKPSQGNPL